MTRAAQLLIALAIGALAIAQASAAPESEGQRPRRPQERDASPRARSFPSESERRSTVAPRREPSGYDDPRFERGM